MHEGGERDKIPGILPFLVLLLFALLIEGVVFQVSSWSSLFHRDRTVFEELWIEGGTETSPGSGQYMAGEEGLQIRIPEVDQEVSNLFLALEADGQTEIPYQISLTDEGNYYAYPLPEQVWIPGLEQTYYTQIHASGKVGEITIWLDLPADSTVTVAGVCANARIPFFFAPLRLLLVLGLLLSGYRIYRGNGEGAFCRGSRGQLAGLAAVCGILLVMGWKLVHINPVCVEAPWPHHRQYQELAEALSKGQVFLDARPSPELMAVENPYDTIYLQANQISYQPDYAYYEGKYYVYFGIVPELLFYLPYYKLTGSHFPNYAAVFLCYSGFVLAVFGLLREMIRTWFPKTTYGIWLLLGSLTVCCGNYLFLVARPDLYNVPIMAANMFTAGGLWLWLKGKGTEEVRKRRLWYLGGSLCMALVAGCRPQMLFFSCLAVPLFWQEVITERKLFSKKGMGDTLCLCLPYVVVAGGIMYYNAARFGSPFDFGATYSLTSNDMTKRSFRFSQALLGIWHYFLQLPAVKCEFPFLEGMQISSTTYMGRLNAEYTYGGMLAGNAFLWILLFAGSVRKYMQHKKVWGAAVMGVLITVFLAVVDVTGAGILQRYMADMIWGIWLAALLVFLSLWDRCEDPQKKKKLLYGLLGICVLQFFYATGIIFGNGDLGINLRVAAPRLYHAVKSLFP